MTLSNQLHLEHKMVLWQAWSAVIESATPNGAPGIILPGVAGASPASSSRSKLVVGLGMVSVGFRTTNVLLLSLLIKHLSRKLNLDETKRYPLFKVGCTHITLIS